MNLVQDSKARYRVLIDLMILCFAFYAYSKNDAPYSKASRFDVLVIDTIAPLQKGVNGVYDSISSVLKHYLLNVDSARKNENLVKYIASLESKISSLSEVEKENERLKDLLNFKQSTTYESIPAKIIAWDSSSDFRTIRIDKGFKDGLRIQSPVVSHKGVVGYIYRMSDHFADILTILDPNNRVDAIVGRTRSYGIAEGFSSDRSIMKYLRITDAVSLNDEVLTSGLGYIYPKGLRLGHISKIERESYGITQHVEVYPSVNFNTLEEVIVLIANNRESVIKELKALDSTGD